MLRVVVDGNIPGVAACLGADAELSHFSGRKLEPDLLEGADALFVRSVTAVDRQLLQHSSVRFVGTATSGFEHVDRAWLDQAGIGFAYAPGSNANSVVEYVLAAIATAGDKLEQLLDGAPLGIVGYGHVGSLLATRMTALGVSTRVYDPWLPRERVPGCAGLSEVLDCAVVSLHCELTQRRPWPSYHLLGRAELRAMPESTLLINASRGAVVDNPALLHTLSTRPGFAVMLDVWEGEPDIDPALLERVRIGTPHIAGYSYDGKLRATHMLCTAMCEHLGLDLEVGHESMPPPPPIDLPDDLTGVALLRYLLRARYDILQDDAALRAAVLGGSRAQAGQHFDDLRRNYPVRRELAGSSLLAPHVAPADARRLSALACH